VKFAEIKLPLQIAGVCRFAFRCQAGSLCYYIGQSGDIVWRFKAHFGKEAARGVVLKRMPDSSKDERETVEKVLLSAARKKGLRLSNRDVSHIMMPQSAILPPPFLLYYPIFRIARKLFYPALNRFNLLGTPFVLAKEDLCRAPFR
jgi:hypothetical protein